MFDLWPQLRSARPRPEEVVAIYPHLGTVPREVWLRLFGSAGHEISILDGPELPLAADREVVTALAERAKAGVKVRICLAGQGAAELTAGLDTGTRGAEVPDTHGLWAPLRDTGAVQIRLHQGALYNFIYRAADQLLVAQRAYGVPAGQAPVLHLQWIEGGDMFTTYVESFERTWADARLQDS